MTHHDTIIKTTNGYYDNITTTVLNKYYESAFTTNTTQFDISPTPQFVQSQADGGANCSVTNDVTLLRNVMSISTKIIGGIRSGITYVAKGDYYITCDDGSLLKVPMYYSPDSTGTVFSPEDIVESHPTYHAWTQHAQCDTGGGYLQFHSKQGLASVNITLI